MDQRFETENYTPATVAHVQDVPLGRDQTVRGRAAFRQAVFRGKPPAVNYILILLIHLHIDLRRILTFMRLRARDFKGQIPK